MQRGGEGEGGWKLLGSVSADQRGNGTVRHQGALFCDEGACTSAGGKEAGPQN